MTRETPQPSAWTTFVATHAPGDAVRATVTKTLPFGVLVEIEGVPGLLKGAVELTVGDSVAGTVGALDPTRQRFSMIC